MRNFELERLPAVRPEIHSSMKANKGKLRDGEKFNSQRRRRKTMTLKNITWHLNTIIWINLFSRLEWRVPSISLYSLERVNASQANGR